MQFIKTLNHELSEYHLLKHSFYQAWNMGYLNRTTLQMYAKEYYHHVAAFPRYISAIHSQCADLPTRQILLGNLVEEEQGEDNHPALWKRFAKGLGVRSIPQRPELKETVDLVEGYFDMVKSDFATGLGALYAYERQTPDVSASKIEGLKKFYDISDEKTLQFFEVHLQADEWHSQECADIIEKLNSVDQEKVKAGAKKGAKLLWGFLDGMMSEHAKNSVP